MKAEIAGFFKKHVPVLVIFLAICAGYCYPVLEGKKIIQTDIMQSLAMQGEMNRYIEQHGEHILWTNGMFSGMPTFMLKAYSAFNFLGNTMIAIQKALPNPMYLIFFCLLGMYIFCQTLGINRWLSMLAAIAFAFGTFNILSIEAGHTSKVRSIAMMAPILAGIIITLRGNLWAGGIVTAVFASLQLTSNHPQITYYTMMIGSLLIVFELVKHFREKQLPQFSKAIGILSAAALIALACNLYLLWPAYEYSKETIRGGASELSDKKEQRKGGGLDKEYAFAWSQGIMESLTFLVPNFSGGASNESLDENSETYKTLVQYRISQKMSQYLIKNVPTYWGNQPFTGGPMYFGASVLFLLLFSLLTTRHPLRWWLLTAMLLSLMLSWGKNFPWLSYFFFDYVPFYNKFRTPSMMLSVVQLTIPVMVALGLNDVLEKKIDKAKLLQNIKIAGGILLGICMLLYANSSLFSFSPTENKENDEIYYEGFYEVTQDQEFAKKMLIALKKDRKTMMQKDTLRSGIIIIISMALLYLFVAGRIKQILFIIAITTIIAIDLFQVDLRYLNEESYGDENEYQTHFRLRKADIKILQDKDLHYRVHDLTSDPFNNAWPSYYHKTIGGYHAAKLQRYQDIIERHLSRGNLDVLNMLNTKYFILTDENNDVVVRQNQFALGNAWFVKNIQWVENADEEITALETFKPDTLAVIDQRYKSELSDLPQTLSASGNIKLTYYHPDKLIYTSESDDTQLAVFSEIFYRGNEDWKSYIDGKEVRHVRVNYLLRALPIPPGKHEIVFEFKPHSYYAGQQVTLAANILLLLLVTGFFANQLTKHKS
jgi:hypothetical protein